MKSVWFLLAFLVGPFVALAHEPTAEKLLALAGCKEGS